MASSNKIFQTFRPLQVVDLKYKNGVASLAISEVFPEDEGEYSLKAINSQGEVETKCKVSVKGENPVLFKVANTTSKNLDVDVNAIYLISSYGRSVETFEEVLDLC